MWISLHLQCSSLTVSLFPTTDLFTNTYFRYRMYTDICYSCRENGELINQWFDETVILRCRCKMDTVKTFVTLRNLILKKINRMLMLVLRYLRERLFIWTLTVSFCEFTELRASYLMQKKIDELFHQRL